MSRKISLIAIFSILTLGLFSQRPTMELTYTAVNTADWVQLDSIKIMNRTQGGDTVLYWPDTVLVLDFVTEIPEARMNDNGFQVFQNYPNPVAGQTTVSLYVPEKDKVSITVTDILGRIIVKSERVLDKGKHSFRFTPGNSSLYFFNACWQGESSSIKILQAGFNSVGIPTLEYTGSEVYLPQLKAIEDIQEFSFSPGNKLSCYGYNNGVKTFILDSPEESTTYTFQFATNIPCPGTPTVEYEGQVYNAVQIRSQCWLKENLNVGEMIQGQMTDNGVIEKYCYHNEPDSCIKYGGLYQWDEMMQYYSQGAQGICPPGWHIPTHEEWKVLAGAVDSYYGIGDPMWNTYCPFIGCGLGYDAGMNLKTTSGWNSGGNGADLFGFSGLPGGGYYSGLNVGDIGCWRTSSSHDGRESYPLTWWIEAYGGIAWSDLFEKSNGLSVRCLRDEIIIPTIELTFTAVNSASYVQLDSIKVMNRTQGGETMIYWPDTTLLIPGYLAFTPGDELLYVGFANGLESGFLDAPEESQAYTFQFATNIPCPGTPTVEYEGQVYNTIQIFSQCWLKENLNVGVLNNHCYMFDNGVIEKCCWWNCTAYGGLYTWDETMQYTTQQGARGICPAGWHLPTIEEWKVLVGAVDSQYGIGEWNIYDAGTNLKSTSGWQDNGNGTDLFGFSALPGGFWEPDLGSGKPGYNSLLWTSTSANGIFLGPGPAVEYWNGFDPGFAGSVRCLRDEIIIPTIEFTFTAVNNASYVRLDSIKVITRTQGGETMIYWPDTTLLVPGYLAFTPGDELLYVGFANGLESGMLASPVESTPYTFQFATNIPCPGTPTVEYEGQVYNTIQIFSQCWLKENLNVGEMIPGTMEQSDNGTIEKYCYNNEPDSCTKYGGLYQWDEMMQYTTQQGAQGICPPGWHLPTNEEWKVLEGSVDSQYGIGDPEWDISYAWRGTDAGMNLKTSSGWNDGGNGTDLFGFSGLPGGYRGDIGGYSGTGYLGHFWSSTESDFSYAWGHYLYYFRPGVFRYDGYSKGRGFSVRCLRDD